MVFHVEDIKRQALEKLERRGPGSSFMCKINGQVYRATYEMLRMWPHCWHPDPECELTYFVETRQSNWLCDRLKPGDCALDVGAAFGLITLAMSRQMGSTGAVHAFEPARTTNALLRKTLGLNRIENVVTVEQAMSEQNGSADFIEYTSENELSWASDASMLAEPFSPKLPNRVTYSVPTITLDEYVETHQLHPVVIKMDIEGMELYALRGGLETLRRYQPALCIDIHKDARTGEDAGQAVREVLTELGYNCQSKEHHALYAEVGRQ